MPLHYVILNFLCECSTQAESYYVKLPLIVKFTSEDKFKQHRANKFNDFIEDFGIAIRQHHGKKYKFLGPIEETVLRYPNLTHHFAAFD